MMKKLLATILLFALMPVQALSANEQGTSTSRGAGAYFKILMSKDDKVCGELKRAIESEFKAQGSQWPSRLDSHEMFVKWNLADNIFGPKHNKYHWSQFDADNDGNINFVVRITMPQQNFDINNVVEFYLIFKSEYKEIALSEKQSINTLFDQNPLILSLETTMAGVARHYPLSQYSNNKQRRPFHETRFRHNGLMSAFQLNGATYYLAYNEKPVPFIDGIWGLAFTVMPDGKTVDMCYFDLIDKAPYKQAEDSMKSSVAGNRGNHLQILMSANDKLCSAIFEVVEHDFRDDQWQWRRRYDDADMFVDWKPMEKFDAGQSFGMEWSEFDINNDGVVELVLRTTFIEEFYGHGNEKDYLDLFYGKNADWLRSQTFFSAREVNQSASAIFNFSPSRASDLPKGIRDRFYPLTLYPSGHDERASKGDTYYYHRGYINPFFYDGNTYLYVFNTSKEAKMNGVLGIVIRLRPDGYTEDICYFDLAEGAALQQE